MSYHTLSALLHYLMIYNVVNHNVFQIVATFLTRIFHKVV